MHSAKSANIYIKSRKESLASEISATKVGCFAYS